MRGRGGRESYCRRYKPQEGIERAADLSIFPDVSPIHLYGVSLSLFSHQLDSNCQGFHRFPRARAAERCRPLLAFRCGDSLMGSFFFFLFFFIGARGKVFEDSKSGLVIWMSYGRFTAGVISVFALWLFGQLNYCCAVAIVLRRLEFETWCESV